MSPRALVLVAAIVGAIFFASVYLPEVGRGFVKDDAAWVATGIASIERPASAWTVESAGLFFRPLVALSFAVDYELHGNRARGYGLTNLALCLGCAAAIGLLFRQLGLDAAAAAIGVLVWALNPHGIAMALLWISGRTSLLMALASTLAISSFVARRRLAGSALLLCALLAKEDAVAVPLIVVACAYAAQKLRRRDLWLDLAWMAAAEAVYFAVRLRTSAMMPSTAPWYYRLSSSPMAIAINAASYLDRAATGAAIVTILAFVAYRRYPRDLSRHHRRLLLTAAVWFVAGLAITVRIPVRSDLYAVFPSIGGALACAAFVDATRRDVGLDALRRRDARMGLILAALLAMVPIYRARNARFAEPARVSSEVQRLLSGDLAALPAAGTIVLEDAPARFATFGDAFGGLSTSAVRLFTGRSLVADIVEAGDAAARPGEVARYKLAAGTVQRVR